MLFSLKRQIHEKQQNRMQFKLIHHKTVLCVSLPTLFTTLSCMRIYMREHALLTDNHKNYMHCKGNMYTLHAYL